MKSPKIIGAATVLASQYNKPNNSLPYYSLLPKADKNELLIDLTLNACDLALSFANCRPDQIDLIISLSVSLSHFVDNTKILGPRITNPVQKELQADNAYVFDLLGSDWVFALDVAQTYALSMGYKRGLIIRSECSEHSIIADMESGFDIADGASALVLDFEAETNHGKGMYHTELSQIPASLLLANNITSNDNKKGLLKLAYQDTLFDDIANAMLALYQQTELVDTVIYERWFNNFKLDTSNITCPVLTSDKLIHGSFDIGSGLSDLLQQGKSSKVLLLTFDPFKMRVGGLSVYV